MSVEDYMSICHGATISMRRAWPNKAEDIMAEAYLALVEAWEQRDNLPCAFEAYAIVKIQQRVAEFVTDDCTVRIPRTSKRRIVNPPRVEHPSYVEDDEDDNGEEEVFVSHDNVLPFKETVEEFAQLGTEYAVLAELLASGYNQVEIARILGTSESSISRRICDMRQYYIRRTI